MNDNKKQLWHDLYDAKFKILESRFPGWLKDAHNADEFKKCQDAAIYVAATFADIAVYGKYNDSTEITLRNCKKILHEAGIKTPKMPDGKLSEQKIEKLVKSADQIIIKESNDRKEQLHKDQLWRSLYDTVLEKLKSEFPDWIKGVHNLDIYEKYDNAAIDVASAFADIAVYGECKECTENSLYESKKRLHRTGIKTPKMPEGKLSEQEIEKLVKPANQINIEQSDYDNKNIFTATLPNKEITLDFLMGDHISMSYSSGSLYREYTTDFNSFKLSDKDKKQLTLSFAEHVIEATKYFGFDDWLVDDKKVFLESLIKAGNDFVNELEQKLQELEIDEQDQEFEDLEEGFEGPEEEL